MRTELFLNVYKNNELYLQRKIELQNKALFLGSSKAADVVLPVQELGPFQLLLVPPQPEHANWRIFDESSETIIDLNEDVQKHALGPWNFEFKVESGFQPEWQQVPHDPKGDIVILSFVRGGSVVRRQYLKLSSVMRLSWKGKEYSFKKSELQAKVLNFENDGEQLVVNLTNHHQLSFLASLSKSLRGGVAAMLILGLVAIGTMYSTHGEREIAQQVEVEKVMVVKIPAAQVKKQPEQQQGSQSAPAQTQQASSQQASKPGQHSIASFGKAFKRFSKGLTGVSISPAHLAGGFATGNLGAKLQGMNNAGGGGDGGDNKIFNAGAVGSTMGRGLAAVPNGIRLLDDEMQSSGGLKKEIIAQYIKSYLGQIVQCFERELSIQPDLTGKVVVNFTIDKQGAVSSALIQKSQFNNDRFHGCITEKVHKWTFPHPEGGINVVVNYPFLFRAQ